MSSTRDDKTERGLYGKNTASQDTLVQPQDASTAEPLDSKHSASSYANRWENPMHKVHKNLFHLLARSLVPEDTMGRDFAPTFAPSYLVKVDWEKTERSAQSTAGQVEWVAPGGWDDEIAEDVAGIVKDISLVATAYGNQADGLAKSNYYRNQARDIGTAARNVAYALNAAADPTACLSKVGLRDTFCELGGPEVEDHTNKLASEFSMVYNDLGNRGDRFTQGKVNNLLGQIHLREDMLDR